MICEGASGLGYFTDNEGRVTLDISLIMIVSKFMIVNLVPII